MLSHEIQGSLYQLGNQCRLIHLFTSVSSHNPEIWLMTHSRKRFQTADASYFLFFSFLSYQHKLTKQLKKK